MIPTTYSHAHRILHWLVAVLVFFNLLLPDGMNTWHRLTVRGQLPDAEDIAAANIHAYVGIAILLLSVARLFLRAKHGVPADPAGQPRFLGVVARCVHATLYILLFAMPLSGGAAYYLGIGFLGSLHAGAIKIFLWTVLILHVAGAIAQHFYFRTDVLRRMTIGRASRS